MLTISVKKNTPIGGNSPERQPKTELDVKFIALLQDLMRQRGIKSDRAMSLELGRGADFVNRVRNGLQSATPEAWDALITKFPEARNITTTNVMAQGGGQAIGNVEGDANYTIGDCERERDGYKKEVEQLREQLAAKDIIIQGKDALLASKEEIISLLRGGYNRQN